VPAHPSLTVRDGKDAARRTTKSWIGGVSLRGTNLQRCHCLTMRRKTSLAPLALLCASACDRTATSPQPEYDPTSAGSVDQAMCLLGFSAVPLRQVQPGQHLVEATINGREGLFVLDTGANVTVVDRARA